MAELSEAALPLDDAQARELTAAYKALGDQTRLRMLVLLLGADEICVCRFEELLGISQSKASRHLRYLTNAGLLEDRREGVWVHYRVRRDLSPALARLVESLRDTLGEPSIRRLEEALVASVQGGPDEGAVCGGRPNGNQEE